MKRVLFGFAFLACLSSWCQQSRLDSLEMKLNDSDEKEQISILIEISNATFFSRTEYSRKKAKKALTLLADHYNGEQLAKVYNLIGITYDIEGRTDSSRHYFLRYYEQCKSIGNIQLAGNALNNLGMSSWNSGRFDDALEYFYESLKIADSLDDRSSVAKSYNNIALINQELNNYERALDLNSKALKIRKELGTRDVADSYNNIGICYKNLGMLDSALFAYNEGINSLEEQDNKRRSELLNNIGNVHLEFGNLVRAEDFLLQSISYQDNKLGNLLGYSSLSEVYFLQGKSLKSTKMGLKALGLANEIGNYGHLEDIYYNLSRAYALSNSMDSFNYYMELWDAVKDSLFSEESNKIYRETEVKYETEKKEQQIALQESMLSQQKAQLERNRFLTIALIVTILSIISLGLLNRNRLKKKQQITLQQERLKTKEAEIKATISSQEKERARYARDLHDGFGQMISILNLNFGSLRKDAKPNERQQIFEESEKVINEMYDELKGICFDLMPQTLVNNGLQSGLEEFTDRVNKAQKVFIETNFFGLEVRLKEVQEISLYRITQEWINNILKYSDAAKVTLQITKDVEEITLLIEDNGSGFDKAKLVNSRGNGWKNLNTRTNLINGQLELETALGKQGNTLIVNAPATVSEEFKEDAAVGSA